MQEKQETEINYFKQPKYSQEEGLLYFQDMSVGRLLRQNCIGFKDKINQEKQVWCVYPEQYLYLVSIFNVKQPKSKSQLVFQAYQRYFNISNSNQNAQSYDPFWLIQVLNFYFYVRKSGKFIQRVKKGISDFKRAFYIFENKENYSKKKYSKVVSVFLCQESINYIFDSCLSLRQKFQNAEVKVKVTDICIARNRDFFFMKVV